MAVPSTGSAYGVALAATEATIRRRANHHRWLVIVVVAITLLSTVGALAHRSWRPLAGWTLLVPCCAAALTLDAALLARWRRRVLDAWAADAIDLDTFRTAVTANRVLPPQTLAGMLATLPTGPASTTDRLAAARILRARDTRDILRSAAITVLLTTVATGVLAAVIFR